MMLDILTFLSLAAAPACFWAGRAVEARKNRRQHAATATCAGCEWTSGPVPLGEAFRLAESHRAMPHPAGFTRTIVERAL